MGHSLEDAEGPNGGGEFALFARAEAKLAEERLKAEQAKKDRARRLDAASEAESPFYPRIGQEAGEASPRLTGVTSAS